MKRSTIELYGIDPVELAELTYKEALLKKLEGGRKTLRKTIDEYTKLANSVKPSNQSGLCEMQANNYLQSDIYRAIQHTEELLEELNTK